MLNAIYFTFLSHENVKNKEHTNIVCPILLIFLILSLLNSYFQKYVALIIIPFVNFFKKDNRKNKDG